VPDAEWEHYIEPKMRGEILCKACYLQIKAWIDGEAVAAVNHAKILFAHHRHGHGSRQLADYLDNIGVSRHQAR
jgi:hypothetical protein